MKTVSMLEFRKNAARVIKLTQRGQQIILTLRGKPVCRLEPLEAVDDIENDPIYRLGELADSEAEDLSSEQIEKIIYEDTQIH